LLFTGDTKVVDRGKGDKIFINTSGVGVINPGVAISPSRAAAGDDIILSGPIALHGIAVMSVREGLAFESEVTSDTAPLNALVVSMLEAAKGIHVLRDPTRGGLATALNEIAESARIGIEIIDATIPVPDQVRGACEILGLDPLYVANEGKLIAFVDPSDTALVRAAMKQHSVGSDAVVIGQAVASHPGTVIMRSRIGGSRVVDMLSGEQLPRIC